MGKKIGVSGLSLSFSGKARILVGYTLAAVSVLVLAFLYEIDFGAGLTVLSRVSPLSMLGAITFIGLHLWLAALAFEVSLRPESGKRTDFPTKTLWMATLLTKYLPGGVWNPITRGGLLCAEGYAVRAVTIASVVEQAAALLIPALLALGFWLILKSGFGSSSAIVFIPILFLVVSVSWSVSLWCLNFRRHVISVAGLQTLSMLAYLLAYVAFMQPPSALNFGLTLFGATAVGMASIFVPGGLGIRESILSAAAEGIGVSEMFALAMGMRVVIIFVESVLSVVASRTYARRGLVGG